MARISIMEALSRVLTASKDYTDEKSILLDEDDGTFNGFFEGAYPELNTVNKTPIGAVNEINSNVNSKQSIVDNTLETESKTIVGAINENKGDIKDIKDELVTDKSIHYSFDVENIEQYDRFSPGSYGYTYCKLTDEIPDIDIDLENATGTITIYTHDKGIITGPISVTKSGNPTRYFIGVEGDDRNPIYILPTGWYPNAGVSFSPGVWTQRYLYDEKEHYLISATIDNVITIKNELENKAELVDEHELIAMLEEELGLNVEE